MKSEYRPLKSLVRRKIGYGIVQPGKDNVGEVHLIKVNNIISGLKNIEDLDRTTSEIEKKYARTRLKGGELVISVVGTPGRTAIVPKSFAGCNLVRAVALIDIVDCLTSWVKYYIDSPNGQNYILQNLNTTVQPTLNIKDLSEMPILIMDRKKMESIVSILSAIDRKIEFNNRINENLESQAQAIFKSRFVDFEPFDGVMPRKWHETVLRNIATISTKSINPLKHPELYLEHYSIPAYDEQHYPVFEYANEIKSNKYVLTKNSVMISKLNPATKRIWRPLCLSDNPVCSTEFIVYEAINPKYKDYIYSLIDSQSFSDYLCAHTTGSTNSRQRATPKTTLDFPCVLPTDDTISQFCEVVTPIYNQIGANLIENQRLVSLRDTLLPKLMNGEIDVSKVKI